MAVKKIEIGKIYRILPFYTHRNSKIAKIIYDDEYNGHKMLGTLCVDDIFIAISTKDNHTYRILKDDIFGEIILNKNFYTREDPLFTEIIEEI